MARGRGKLTPQDIEYMKSFSNNLNQLLSIHNKKQIELSRATGIPPTTLTGYVKGTSLPIPGNVQKIADFFGILKSDIDSRFLEDSYKVNDEIPVVNELKHNYINKTLQSIIDVSTQLHENRQQNVLSYAEKQLDEQHNEKVIDISVLKENNTDYQEKQRFPVQVTESLAAGRGYSYNENNETVTVYTDRDNLQWHNLASFINGDSMEPKYHNGDVALIQKGFDNIQGAVYAVDYNGKAYIKKLYNDGHQFRLVSINDKYDDILIDIPVDEDIYFNIVGRVVDSFTPVED